MTNSLNVGSTGQSRTLPGTALRVGLWQGIRACLVLLIGHEICYIYYVLKLNHLKLHLTLSLINETLTMEHLNVKF